MSFQQSENIFWPDSKSDWVIGTQIYRHANTLFAVASVQKRPKSPITASLKIAKDPIRNVLIDMEREILTILGKRNVYIRPLQETCKVRYDPLKNFVGFRGAKLHYALVFEVPKQDAYSWFQTWHKTHTTNVPASSIRSLLLSALQGLKFIHDEGITLRKLELSDWEIFGTAEEPKLRYTNFINACIMPDSRHIGNVDVKRWIERQTMRDYDVRLTSPELAAEIIEKQKRPNESYVVDSTVLYTSDVFLVGMALYAGLNQCSLYSPLFPAEAKLGPQDLHRIVRDYALSDVFYLDIRFKDVMQMILNPNDIYRKDVDRLLAMTKLITESEKPDSSEITFLLPTLEMIASFPSTPTLRPPPQVKVIEPEIVPLPLDIPEIPESFLTGYPQSGLDDWLNLMLEPL